MLFFFNAFYSCNNIFFNYKDKNLKKTVLLSKEKNNNNDIIINNLVKIGRINKHFIEINFNYLNISEFVSSNKQNEIYYNSNREIYFLKNNLVIFKKFSTNLDLNYEKKINKNFYNYFFKIKNLGNFFFVQYRIYGLGFKIKKSYLAGTRSLRFEIGFGHGIYYILPSNVKCLKRKRRFFLFSDNFNELQFVKNHINKFKLLNPYKIRGLKDLKKQIRMKKGKKQSKK
jgi:hypothetical protein